MVFYEVENDCLERREQAKDCSRENVTVGYVTLKELEQEYSTFGFPKELLATCREAQSRSRSNLEVYDTFSFVLLWMPDLQNMRATQRRVALFLQKNLCLFVNISDTEQQSYGVLVRILENLGRRMTIERVIGSFLLHLVDGGSESLEHGEQQVTAMEERILSDHPDPEINRRLFRMKSRLTLQQSYYEGLVELGESLAENENNLFSESENFRYLNIAVSRIQRLSGHTQSMKEELEYLRETYQSALDYNLNNIMKLFTVVTTIFLPLSLIAAWYGMNFQMPEFGWKYGYLAVIVVSVAVLFVCLWFFKKKKLF